VSTLSFMHATYAETFSQVWSLVCASPTPLVTRLCVHYNVVLSFATRILLDRLIHPPAWHAHGHVAIT